MEHKKKKNIKNEFKPLLRFIKEDKFKIILAIIILMIVAISETLTGYLNGRAVEAITKLNLKEAFLFLGIYFGLGIIVEAFLNNYSSNMLQKIESRLTRKLGYHTYIKALNLPAVAYEEKSSGEIINRISNDADSLSFVIGRVLNMITYLLGTVAIFIYVIFKSWIVALEITVFIIIFSLVVKKFNVKLKETYQARKKEHDRFITLVNESIRGIRELKTLGIKKKLISDVADINKDIYKASSKELDVYRTYSLITRSLRSMLEVGVFLTCCVELYYGRTSLTFFIAMTYYVYRFTWIIDSVTDFTQTYQSVVVSLERVNELLENRLYEDVLFGDKVIKDPIGKIEFKNVTFNYPKEKVTLKDFNLTIEPGKKIAIVGASGQGKTTLFNLLTRIFDPKKGEILLDGINIKDLTEDELRHHISIIRQEPFIFNRSIIDNFRLLDEHIKLSEVKKYTQMAYLDEYIESLPKKYNTILGEGGVNLSGGQKQRLAIARTLSKDSKVILFDEATSALDNNSQEFIKKAIDDLVKDHTVIIVAHRLSTIQDADVIYVVDKGTIAESGTHDELMKKSKIYKNLYKTESLNS
ncbi:MAG: ABC transporter ATP-binding protein [Erysipelotrichales bacterium]|nr:ABC transporter ATP-binding protein [Erysipelotrichales bacterium]